MNRFSGFVLRHKVAVALFWLAVFLAGAAVSGLLSDRLSYDFRYPHADSQRANDAILGRYGNGANTYPIVPVVVLPKGTTMDDPGARQALSEAFAVAKVDPRMRIVSYASTGDQRFVTDGGQTTFGLVFTPRQQGMNGTDYGPAITQAMSRALPPGASVHLTGLTQLSTADSTGSGSSVLAETLVGGLGALAVLAFVFGSLLALVPLLIAAVAILATFLVVFGLTTFTDVSFIVQFLTALVGLGVAIDYSLLLVTRWREERANGHDNEDAVRLAMASAGRAVLFSGVTVAIGLVALVFLPVPFMRSVGYGGMLIPLVSVLVSLTLLPVLLATVGRRVDWPRLRTDTKASRAWSGWARGVVRLRWIAALGAVLILAGLSAAALDLKLGDPQSKALAASASPAAAAGLTELTRSGVPSGVLTPIEILAPAGVDADGLARSLAAVPGVYGVTAPADAAWRRDGTALVTVLPVAESSTDAGKQTIARVREAAAQTPGVQVGGLGALVVDGVDALYGPFPLVLAIIGLVTFVLLARAFRSLLLPLKAVLLNLISLAASYGVLVLVWQRGYGSDLIWGIPATGAITFWVPLMGFAFLYGLSMDYEVFILSRMREEYDRTGSTTAAVVAGIGRTGRLVTSAALILFLAFVSLGTAPNTDIKILATALGVGILLDATVVRSLLVPATVSLFGRWNWWLPEWAARILRVAPSPAAGSPAIGPLATGSPADVALRQGASIVTASVVRNPAGGLTEASTNGGSPTGPTVGARRPA
jgi:RND superfamily putative drug exporter